LSPQVILLVFGGHTTQTTQKIEVCLAKGFVLDAHLCPQSCLPLFLFVLGGSKLSSFWTYAFAYSANNDVLAKTNPGSTNNNLSSSQKELLLWHQRLSHANLGWIQTLMHDRKWLQDSSSMASLHSGPFIVSLSWAPTCDIQGLKCLACLCAKARTCTTKSKSTTLQPEKNQVLKRGHLMPGCCVSVDHYMSSVMRRLPHTFGREQIGYSCGLLFVDHASGKQFNFCQYSTTAAKTLSNKCQLESIAWQERITIQEYHADNGILASKAFKADCDSLDKNILLVLAHIIRMVLLNVI
jgi:hypothetical protein